MRVTRSRSAASKRKASDFVDLDSEELEEVIAEAETPSSKRSRRQATTSKTDGSSRQASTTNKATNTQSEAEQDSSYADGDDEDEEEFEEVSNESGDAQDNSGDEADSQLSDSSSDDEAYTSSDNAANSKSQQQKSHQKRAKKPRKKRLCTRRICASYAKSLFQLTDNDLADLTDEQRVNPYYPAGPMMKLYLVRELQELAQRKQAEKARWAATARERALERAAAARAKKVAAAAAAAEAVKAMGDKASKHAEDKYGSFKLPETCLSRIMEYIADDLEPGGLRGPTCVARQLYQASLVCWDFYHASKAGFAALAEATTTTLQQVLPQQLSYAKWSTSQQLADSRRLVALHSLPGPEESGVTWSFWDSVIKDPTALKLPQLKDAARLLTLPVTGTKAELVVRILGVFGLRAPTAAPAKLVRTLILERVHSPQFWDGPDGGWHLQSAVSNLQNVRHPSVTGLFHLGSAAALRKHLLRHFSSLPEMQAVATAAMAEHAKKGC